jgi:hypothetical protein
MSQVRFVSQSQLCLENGLEAGPICGDLWDNFGSSLPPVLEVSEQISHKFSRLISPMNLKANQKEPPQGSSFS